MRQPAIYIMASGTNATLYIGVTSNLIQRVWQHRNGTIGGFTKRYGCTRLVNFEPYPDMASAITREKQLKDWSRARKHSLIAAQNPTWHELYESIIQ